MSRNQTKRKSLHKRCGRKHSGQYCHPSPWYTHCSLKYVCITAMGGGWWAGFFFVTETHQTRISLGIELNVGAAGTPAMMPALAAVSKGLLPATLKNYCRRQWCRHLPPSLIRVPSENCYGPSRHKVKKYYSSNLGILARVSPAPRWFHHCVLLT